MSCPYSFRANSEVAASHVFSYLAAHSWPVVPGLDVSEGFVHSKVAGQRRVAVFGQH